MGEDKLTGPRGGGRMICTDDGIGRGGGASASVGGCPDAGALPAKACLGGKIMLAPRCSQRRGVPQSRDGLPEQVFFIPGGEHKHMASPRNAFTLIEMLVVMASIGILAGLLLPVLSKAKNRAVMTTDLNHFRQLGEGLHLYASDSGDEIAWPNWFAGDDPGGAPRAGWLYTLDTTVSGPARFKAATGLFWNYLKDGRMYLCPMDYTNTPLFAQRDQQISSYVMNGAVIGYNRMVFPCVKLGNMAPEAVAFWETDEAYPSYFNDGASYPAEGVSPRHLQGAINSTFDGSASYIKFDTWYAEADQTNKNQLWCYPNSPDGR